MKVYLNKHDFRLVAVTKSIMKNGMAFIIPEEAEGKSWYGSWQDVKHNFIYIGEL